MKEKTNTHVATLLWRLVCAICCIVAALALIRPPQAFALTTQFADNTGSYVDNEQAARLSERLTALSNQSGVDVSAVITAGLYDDDDGAYEDWARSYFLSHSKGSGANAVLLVIFEDYIYIYTNGEASNVFNQAAREHVIDTIESAARQKDYVKAVTLFADKTEAIVNAYNAGEPYRAPFDWRKYTVISFIVGAIVSLTVVTFMRRKLKSVEYRSGAADYVRPGSFNVKRAHDFYLYSTVTRVPRPKPSDHDGNRGSSFGGSGRRM